MVSADQNYMLGVGEDMIAEDKDLILLLRNTYEEVLKLGDMLSLVMGINPDAYATIISRSISVDMTEAQLKAIKERRESVLKELRKYLRGTNKKLNEGANVWIGEAPVAITSDKERHTQSFLPHPQITGIQSMILKRKKKRNELTEELACAIGFDLIYRDGYFILGGIGGTIIKEKIVDGVAKDVSICYDTTPNGLDKLPHQAAMAYAHRIISTTYFAKRIEGMPVIGPKKEDLWEY